MAYVKFDTVRILKKCGFCRAKVFSVIGIRNGDAAVSTSNPFSAADSALGYLYQVRTALLWALRRLKVGSEFLVSLETLDDVTLAMRRERRIAKVAMARKLAVNLYWMWRKQRNFSHQ